jgi:hypothetical protein
VSFSADVDGDIDAEVTGAKPMKVKAGVHSHVEGRYEVLSVESNGDFKVKMTYNRLVAKVFGPEERNYDVSEASADPAMKPLAAALKAPVLVRMSATGQLLEMDMKATRDAMEKVGNKEAAESLTQATAEILQTSFTRIPEKPVKAGDGFDAGEIAKTMRGVGDVKANVRYEVLSVSADKKQVLLRAKGAFKAVQAKDKTETRKVDSGTVDGWLLFDAAAGNLTRSAIDMAIRMSFSSDNEQATIDVKAKVKYGVDNKTGY